MVEAVAEGERLGPHRRAPRRGAARDRPRPGERRRDRAHRPRMDRVITFEAAHLKAVAEIRRDGLPRRMLRPARRHGRGRARLAGPSRGAEPQPRARRIVRDRFEIDPALHLDLQRRASGHRRGHRRRLPLASRRRHSAPSATDLESAWQPGLVWLIAAVRAGGRVSGDRGAPLRRGRTRDVRFEEILVRAEMPRCPGDELRERLHRRRLRRGHGRDQTPRTPQEIALLWRRRTPPRGSSASSPMVFETEVRVFPVISGTAANALSMATFVPALWLDLLPRPRAT